MRMIPENNLPQAYQHLSVIKATECNGYKRLALALERTLASCSSMYAEYESQTMILRENSKKEGFTTGFELFFSQLAIFIDDYEQRQNARLAALRANILSSIKESFHDTVIVERIIHNLQVQCNQQKPLRIIIPKTVQLPDSAEYSNYVLSDESHITIQNDRDSIRFPIDAVCQKWIAEADNVIHPLNQEISELTTQLLNSISQIASSKKNRVKV